MGITNAQLDFTHDADGRLSGISRSNGVDTTFTRDDASRLTRKQDGAFIDLQFTYNSAGEITETDVTVPLDPADFLPPETSNLTYDAVAQISSTGYAHDARGRQTTSPDQNYDWDNANRLVQIVKNGVSTLMGYNGLGNLRLRDGSGEKLKFYYNGAIDLSPIAADQDNASGKMLRYYVYTPSGRLLYMIDHENADALYFYHFDQVGSTLALTNASGDVTDKYAYAPHGKVLRHEGDSPQPFTFVGRWGVRSESDTLYYMRARY